jgi:hypothetical protein
MKMQPKIAKKEISNWLKKKENILYSFPWSEFMIENARVRAD